MKVDVDVADINGLKALINKIGYENILGLAYYVIGFRPSWIERYDNWVWKKKLEKIEKYLTSNFKKGSVLAIMFKNHRRKISNFSN